jgi:hypothetical protein
MNMPDRRAEDLIEAWMRATAKPVPAFVPRTSRRRWPAAALIAVGFILAAMTVGVVAIGAYLTVPRGPIAPADLLSRAVDAVRSAPGLEYTVAITTNEAGGGGGLRSTGRIDFQHGRFSGAADPGTASYMLLFGGPQSGGAVVADGLFVQSEGGPWERIPDPRSPLDKLTDPVGLATAIQAWIASSGVDTAVRFAPCGTQTCQLARLTVPPRALFDLAGYVIETTGTPPPDLGPFDVDLLVDPSGFPVRMETRVTAGATTTVIALDLVRLDPAPSITAPIP